MTRFRFAVFLLLLGAVPVAARINSLEPWSPGADLDIPQTPFNHSVNLRYGSGARGVDFTEIAYAFTGPLTREIEAGASWGFASLDSSGIRERPCGPTPVRDSGYTRKVPTPGGGACWTFLSAPNTSWRRSGP